MTKNDEKFTQFRNFKSDLGKISVSRIAAKAFDAGDFLKRFLGLIFL